jgi:hypothetical protein
MSGLIAAVLFTAEAAGVTLETASLVASWSYTAAWAGYRTASYVYRRNEVPDDEKARRTIRRLERRVALLESRARVAALHPDKHAEDDKMWEEMN